MRRGFDDAGQLSPALSLQDSGIEERHKLNSVRGDTLLKIFRKNHVNEALFLDTGKVDQRLLRQIVDELAPLVQINDIQANQIITTHGAFLKTALGSLGAELVAQIEHFLYPEALETLKLACLSSGIGGRADGT